MVSGRCLEGVLKVSGRCLEGVWKVSRGNGVWKVFGGCLEFNSTGNEIKPYNHCQTKTQVSGSILAI